MHLLVRNIGRVAWHWPYTEDGTPDRVEPGEEYEIDLSPKGRQPGESSFEYRARVDRESDEGDPRIKMLLQLRDARLLAFDPPTAETMH
jgi:hypothetical protein